MKRSNRVFFKSSAEAMDNGYRPCGHCMRQQYVEVKQRMG
jgi:methylphosphotriester-DNA--protein-cysteine methyltransferase